MIDLYLKCSILYWKCWMFAGGGSSGRHEGVRVQNTRWRKSSCPTQVLCCIKLYYVVLYCMILNSVCPAQIAGRLCRSSSRLVRSHFITRWRCTRAVQTINHNDPFIMLNECMDLNGPKCENEGLTCSFCFVCRCKHFRQAPTRLCVCAHWNLPFLIKEPVCTETRWLTAICSTIPPF